ncbi:unnamed protein product [Natator depressus]
MVQRQPHRAGLPRGGSKWGNLPRGPHESFQGPSLHKNFRWHFGSRSFSAAKHTRSEGPAAASTAPSHRQQFSGGGPSAPCLWRSAPKTPGPLNPLGGPERRWRQQSRQWARHPLQRVLHGCTELIPGVTSRRRCSGALLPVCSPGDCERVFQSQLKMLELCAPTPRTHEVSNQAYHFSGGTCSGIACSASHSGPEIFLSVLQLRVHLWDWVVLWFQGYLGEWQVCQNC